MTRRRAGDGGGAGRGGGSRARVAALRAAFDAAVLDVVATVRGQVWAVHAGAPVWRVCAWSDGDDDGDDGDDGDGGWCDASDGFDETASSESGLTAAAEATKDQLMATMSAEINVLHAELERKDDELDAALDAAAELASRAGAENAALGARIAELTAANAELTAANAALRAELALVRAPARAASGAANAASDDLDSVFSSGSASSLSSVASSAFDHVVLDAEIFAAVSDMVAASAGAGDSDAAGSGGGSDAWGDDDDDDDAESEGDTPPPPPPVGYSPVTFEIHALASLAILAELDVRRVQAGRNSGALPEALAGAASALAHVANATDMAPSLARPLLAAFASACGAVAAAVADLCASATAADANVLATFLEPLVHASDTLSAAVLVPSASFGPASAAAAFDVTQTCTFALLHVAQQATALFLA